MTAIVIKPKRNEQISFIETLICRYEGKANVPESGASYLVGKHKVKTKTTANSRAYFFMVTSDLKQKRLKTRNSPKDHTESCRFVNDGVVDVNAALYWAPSPFLVGN